MHLIIKPDTSAVTYAKSTVPVYSPAPPDETAPWLPMRKDGELTAFLDGVLHCGGASDLAPDSAEVDCFYFDPALNASHEFPSMLASRKLFSFSQDDAGRPMAFRAEVSAGDSICRYC